MKATPISDITDQKGRVLFKKNASYQVEVQNDLFDSSKRVHTVYCENKVPHDFTNEDAFHGMFRVQ